MLHISALAVSLAIATGSAQAQSMGAPPAAGRPAVSVSVALQGFNPADATFTAYVNFSAQACGSPYSGSIAYAGVHDEQEARMRASDEVEKFRQAVERAAAKCAHP